MEKLPVLSNLSFSHSVFKRLVLQTRKNVRLFGKGLYFTKQQNFCQLLKLKALVENDFFDG